MSDEQPENEGAANDSPADEDVPASEGAPANETEPVAEATGAPDGPPPGPPKQSSAWLVPKWVVAALAAFVVAALLAGGSFAIGRVTASGGGDHERHARFEPRFPGPGQGPRGGQGPGGGPRVASGVFLGVSTQDATGGQQGAQIGNVVSGSPAATAGLQSGDVITAVDGNAVTSAADLAQSIRSHQPGDQVTITYSRGGNSAQAQVQLGNRAAAAAPAS